MRFIKPLDQKIITDVFQNFNQIITIEDGVIKGGFGASILQEAQLKGYKGSINILGIPDNFIEHGTTNELHDICGLSEQKIVKKITQILSQN